MLKSLANGPNPWTNGQIPGQSRETLDGMVGRYAIALHKMREKLS